MAAAAIGILGNQLVARYKLRVGRRIQSATLISDAKHSWLDALSSAGALAGLIGVALGQRWADPVAGLVVTLFICHVGCEVTSDIVRRLLDGVDDGAILAVAAALLSRGVLPSADDSSPPSVGTCMYPVPRDAAARRTLRRSIIGPLVGAKPVRECAVRVL